MMRILNCAAMVGVIIMYLCLCTLRIYGALLEIKLENDCTEHGRDINDAAKTSQTKNSALNSTTMSRILTSEGSSNQFGNQDLDTGPHYSTSISTNTNPDFRKDDLKNILAVSKVSLQLSKHGYNV